jgi:DNA-binding XRE family transcriptional regulator
MPRGRSGATPGQDRETKTPGGGQGDYVHDYPGNWMRSERAISRDARAKKAGTSRECVRKLEAGVYDLTVGTLQRLATALGVQ